MESLSRLQLYRTMLNSSEYSHNQRIAIEINIAILSGIEELFLSQDESPELKEVKDPAILNILQYNIAHVRRRELNDVEINRLLRKLDKLVQAYSNKKEDEAQNSRNLFNKIINELGTYNSKILLDGQVPLSDREKGKLPQVFLSHAYDDKLYALALFEFFYDNRIYLYVDWMHHGKMKDGIELKKNLQKELDESGQLLFLRTINSELDIQGKHMLRSWCAWELGNFYRKKNDEKYMINLYSVEDFKSDYNIQLHGVKIFSGITGGCLMGREISV